MQRAHPPAVLTVNAESLPKKKRDAAVARHQEGTFIQPAPNEHCLMPGTVPSCQTGDTAQRQAEQGKEMSDRNPVGLYYDRRCHRELRGNTARREGILEPQRAEYQETS